MTPSREEMAQEVQREADIWATNTSSDRSQQRALLFSSAAAELRKTCATCENWSPFRSLGTGCLFTDFPNMPADGSGFCHRWEEKP